MSDVTSRCSLPTNRESAISKRWSGGCNFRFMGTLILIFFKVLKLEIPVS